jgi:hypothetical protein
MPAPYEWACSCAALRSPVGCGIRLQTSRHLTSPLQEASGPHEFRRKYGKANRNDYERRPRQNDQSNPDERDSSANDGDNDAFGEAKLRMLIAFHLIAARFSRIRPSLSR